MARVSVSAVDAYYVPTGTRGESAVFVRERGENADVIRFETFDAAQRYARERAADLENEGHTVSLSGAGRVTTV